MAIYYFDTYNNDDEFLDDLGTDLDGLPTASAQARQLVVDLAREHALDHCDRDLVCVVRCADRIVRFKTLLSVRSEWGEASECEATSMQVMADRERV